MHVLPDSFDMLWSDCLDKKPWHEFPFSGFAAMLSAVVTMMVDSLATSYYSQKGKKNVIIPAEGGGDQEMGVVHAGHHHHFEAKTEGEESQLLRYRVVAMVI